MFLKQKLGNLRLGPERKKLLMDQVWGGLARKSWPRPLFRPSKRNFVESVRFSSVLSVFIEIADINEIFFFLMFRSQCIYLL